MTVASHTIAPASPIKAIALDYYYGLKGLFSCPREIWIIFLVKILESLCGVRAANRHGRRETATWRRTELTSY